MKLNIPWTHIFAFLGAVLSTAAYAQGYPAKSVLYIVPSLPGGGSDIVGRMMAAHLSQTFKQQVVVDNRAGGGGNIGAEIAAKSMPDGHTIFQMAVTHTINVTLYKNLAYDLRPRARFYADHAAGFVAAGSNGAPLAVSENPRRSDPCDESKTRRHQLRVGRHRHADAYGSRTLQPPHCH